MVSQATGALAGMADGDLLGGAGVIVVVQAAGDLAGADAGVAQQRAAMGLGGQKSVAAGMDAVADCDRTGVAAVAAVVGAFGDGALADHRHVQRNRVHTDLPDI